MTGASGHLGRKVADLLLERLDPSEVILLTRTPDALASYAERGVVVRHADFDEPSTLAEAFSGTERALLISALDFERRIGQHRAAIGAAKTAGVRHVTTPRFRSPKAIRRLRPRRTTRPSWPHATAGSSGPSCGTTSTPTSRSVSWLRRSRAGSSSRAPATFASRTSPATTALPRRPPCSSRAATRGRRTTSPGRRRSGLRRSQHWPPSWAADQWRSYPSTTMLWSRG